jgi:hypothetical protein
LAFCLVLTTACAADQASAPAPIDKTATASDSASAPPIGTGPRIDLLTGSPYIASHAASELPKSTDPLIDPLTGTPYIAVHNPSIVESAIFMIEFKRAHPSERALFLTGEIRDAQANTFDPAVAFTWKGTVYFHDYCFGDVPIPGLSPEQVSEGYMSRLHKAYVKLLTYYFIKSCAQMHITYPMPAETAYYMGANDTFPHLLPNELPGDNGEIQAKRVETRLKKLGLTTAKAHFNVSGTDKYGKSVTVDTVTFNFGDFTYGWQPRGCAYLGLASKTYLPGMLDSIIFSIDYQKAHPTEKVFCFLHQAADGHIAATTVFTKNGQLWFHHLAPGDLSSALTLDDLKDSDRVIHADLMVYKPALKKFDEDDAQLRHQPPSGLKRYLNGYKAPDLSVDGILAELQKRGVEAKIYTGSDSPELIFVWGNKSFTYKPGLGCFAGQPQQTTASN